MLALLADYTMQLLVKCRRYIQSQEEYSGSDYWRVSGRSHAPPRGIHEPVNDTTYGVDDDDEINNNNSSPARIRKVGGDESLHAKNDDGSDPMDYIYDRNRIFNIVDLGYETMGGFGKVLVYILFFSCNLGVCTIYLVAFSDLMNSMVCSTQAISTSNGSVMIFFTHLLHGLSLYAFVVVFCFFVVFLFFITPSAGSSYWPTLVDDIHACGIYSLVMDSQLQVDVSIGTRRYYLLNHRIGFRYRIRFHGTPALLEGTMELWPQFLH